MNFFRVTSRQDFASYSAVGSGESIEDQRIIPPHRVVANRLQEYHGQPPRKAGKHGAFHSTASSYFVRGDALALFASASRDHITTRRVTIDGREGEEFYQLWVLNFVDCLDEHRTIASPPGGFYKGKIGVIKRPAFDEARWDGSDVFVVPQDPSYCLFCTESFVDTWKTSKLKGIMFTRFLMDPDAIRC